MQSAETQYDSIQFMRPRPGTQQSEAIGRKHSYTSGLSSSSQFAPLRTAFSLSLWVSAAGDPFCFLLNPGPRSRWKPQARISILTCCIATPSRLIPTFLRSKLHTPCANIRCTTRQIPSAVVSDVHRSYSFVQRPSFTRRARGGNDFTAVGSHPSHRDRIT
jgi:hypothetical protein